MGYNQSLTLITVVFSINILLISIADFVKKKKSYLIENLISYVFYLAFLIVQSIFDFHVELFIILLVQITIIGNNLIGKYLEVYNRSIYYDRFLHALGSFSYALFFYSILEKVTVHTVSSRVYASLFVTALGISFGCLYEIYEFILDSTSKKNNNNQHGLTDTDFDLISDVIGSAIAGIISSSIFF